MPAEQEVEAACCSQSIAKRLSPLRLLDFEVVSSVNSSANTALSGCHDNVQLIRRQSDKKLLVWKRIHYGDMDEAELKMLLSELMVIRQIKHANIVEYIGRIVDDTNQDVYIVTEYCSNGDLAGVIRKHIREGISIPEPQIWKWVTQLSLALRCCHCRQGVKAVLHRDLKPANCFLDSAGNLKLGDFGLARVLRDSASFASTFVGTPYYMSPEQMQKSAYTEKSDIWSLGIVAYELACLRPPFVADRQRDLASRIRRGEFEPPPDSYSPALRSLIADCLTVDADQRPTVDDLLRRPEMRAQLGPDDAPEASLRRWTDQLREFADLLSAWQDSLGREEFELRRQEASLAAAAAARQMELERREAKLNRLARQVDDRIKQLAELQDWLKQTGLSAAAAAVAAGTTVRSEASCSSTPDSRTVLQENPISNFASVNSTIECRRNSDSNNHTTDATNHIRDYCFVAEFEDTLPVPSISLASPSIITEVSATSNINALVEDDLMPKSRHHQPAPTPPVPLPRRSVMQRANFQLASNTN